ncbi:MAG: DUF5710 domain-containing protein [Solirubrobacteraceae bacterium]
MREGQHDLNRTYLDVPFQDKDQAKAFGARWDPEARSWYAPAGIATEPFVRWLAVQPAEDAPVLTIIGLPQPCWKCGEDTMAVVACEDEGQLVFAGPDVLQIVASQFSPEQLAEIGVGPLRPRFSRTLERSAWSNGCVACGALLGGFPLFEDFAQCQADQVELPVIASARVPLDILYGEPDPEP